MLENISVQGNLPVGDAQELLQVKSSQGLKGTRAFLFLVALTFSEPILWVYFIECCEDSL